MTDAATAASVWPVLLPAIVGGSLAVLGGTFSPVVAHILSSRKVRHEHRVQRFEQMTTAIYDHNHWLELRRRSVGFGEALEPGPAPMHRAISIALLYFPEMVTPIRQLEVPSGRYEQWIAKAAGDRVAGRMAFINEGFEPAYKRWLEEFNAFQIIAGEYVSSRDGRV